MALSSTGQIQTPCPFTFLLRSYWPRQGEDRSGPGWELEGSRRTPQKLTLFLNLDNLEGGPVRGEFTHQQPEGLQSQHAPQSFDTPPLRTSSPVMSACIPPSESCFSAPHPVDTWTYHGVTHPDQILGGSQDQMRFLNTIATCLPISPTYKHCRETKTTER